MITPYLVSMATAKLIEKAQTQVETGVETTMINERVYKMTFESVSPMYLQKAEKKGHTKDEGDAHLGIP